MPKKAGSRLERRHSTRADAQLSMRVEGRPADGDLTKIVTESQNISASGVYCTSPHYLAPLSKVALTIVLPNRAAPSGSQRLLKCDGVVVRCLQAARGPRPHAYELACSFLGLENRHRALIEEFVTWRNLHAMHRANQKKKPPRTGRRAPGGVTGRVTRKTATKRSAAPRTRRSASR